MQEVFSAVWPFNLSSGRCSQLSILKILVLSLFAVLEYAPVLCDNGVHQAVLLRSSNSVGYAYNL